MRQTGDKTYDKLVTQLVTCPPATRRAGTDSPFDKAQSLDALKRRDYIPDLDRKERFWRPTTVSVDEDFRVFVVDAARFRVQVYRETFKDLSLARPTR